MSDYHSTDISRLGSERHTDSEFVFSLIHRKRNQPIHSNGGQSERQTSEQPEQFKAQPRLFHGAATTSSMV